MSEPRAPNPTPVRCWQCDSEVEAGAFCVVCGHSLAEEIAAREAAGGRFRADPAEPARSLRVLSTLFPQLPRAELDGFRLALGIGTVAVLLLTFLELYPVAVVVAATVVPLLVVLYVYEVDIYEDQPLLVLGATLAWGAAAGAAIALLARGLESGAAPAQPSADPAGTLLEAVVLAISQLAAILVGPIGLLRHRRFNDVLDGATFGVASASAFACTYTLVSASDLLASGLRPGGESSAWALVTLNVALLRPILLAGLAGAVCAALWLRYRGPARDRAAMGALGMPLAAVVLATLLLLAAGLAGAVLADGPATLLRAALAGAALIWLRGAIHLGLRQEAAEVAIGAPVACGNCGRLTSRHSFCSHCGISLRALPKRARGRPPDPSTAGDAP